MTSIEDYGRHIPGAAKHRRLEDWRDRAKEDGQTLSEIFPEPDWDAMREAGVPARNLGLVRALRDALGTKPQKPERQVRWLRNLRAVTAIARMLSDPGRPAMTDAEAARVGLSDHLPKADVYAVLGHDRSLRNYAITHHRGDFVALEGRRVRAAGRTIEELATAIDALLERSAGRHKVAWYTRPLERGRRDGPVMILAKLSGGIRIDVERAPSVEEARRRVLQEGDRLRAILERIRTIPSERAARNSDRQGPPRRQGDVTTEMLGAAFGIDGLQFGSSLMDSERQNELNQAHDALADLAFALGGKLGIRAEWRRPGLAFGARGKGGVNAAKAHYEPDLHVVNLTRRAGAGSLAHEWFHSMDDDSAPFRLLATALAGTKIRERSAELDLTRSSPYWATPREMTARSFEAWVRHRLAVEGIRNDYLANLVDAEDWAAEDVMGLARYPYPLDEEMPVIDRAFSEMFGLTPLEPRQDPARKLTTVNLQYVHPAAAGMRQQAESMSDYGKPGASEGRTAREPEGPRWMDDLDF